jgi:hypothetical protein
MVTRFVDNNLERMWTAYCRAATAWIDSANHEHIQSGQHVLWDRSEARVHRIWGRGDATSVSIINYTSLSSVYTTQL